MKWTGLLWLKRAIFFPFRIQQYRIIMLLQSKFFSAYIRYYPQKQKKRKTINKINNTIVIVRVSKNYPSYYILVIS